MTTYRTPAVNIPRIERAVEAALHRIQRASVEGRHKPRTAIQWQCYEVSADGQRVTAYALSLPSLGWLTAAFKAEGCTVVSSGQVRGLPYVVAKLGAR